jgi:hypothetical protein
MSSDATGEIYVITSQDGGSIDSKTLNVTGLGAPPKKSGAVEVGNGGRWVGLVVAVVVMVLWL